MSQGVGSQALSLQSLLSSPQSIQQGLRENGLKAASPPEAAGELGFLEDSFAGKPGRAFYYAVCTSQRSRHRPGRLTASLGESAGEHHPHGLLSGWGATAETYWIDLSTEACPRDLLPAASSSRRKG